MGEANASAASIQLARPGFAAGLSVSGETEWAASQACEQVRAGLPRSPDVVFAFFNPQHVDNAADIARTIRAKLDAPAVVGVSTCAAFGATVEMERGPGLSLLGATLPGVRLTPFCADDMAHVDDDDEARGVWGPAMGAARDLRACFLFADPASTPVLSLLPRFNAAIGARPLHAFNRSPDDTPAPALFGAVASAGNQADMNVMILNDRVVKRGFVGVGVAGRIDVATVVSQGCRPVGPTMVVTKARANLVLELGGRPAMEAVSDALDELGEKRREVLRGGVYLGVVIDEHRARFGRGDFLISNVVGINQESASIAVAGFPRVGQTVRVHVRDVRTAREDLALLLDAQKLYDPPLGALLVSCNNRGERMFGEPSHDARAVQRAFAHRDDDDETTPYYAPPTVSVALAGMHAAGEIGPIGGRGFLHTQSACLAVFRETGQ